MIGRPCDDRSQTAHLYSHCRTRLCPDVTGARRPGPAAGEGERCRHSSVARARALRVDIRCLQGGSAQPRPARGVAGIRVLMSVHHDSTTPDCPRLRTGHRSVDCTPGCPPPPSRHTTCALPKGVLYLLTYLLTIPVKYRSTMRCGRVSNFLPREVTGRDGRETAESSTNHLHEPRALPWQLLTKECTGSNGCCSACRRGRGSS